MTPTPPSPETLRKYGLTAADWYLLLDRQGGVCAVCKKVPTTGRLCVDHYHVKGWKKMPEARRKLYVRGLLCFFCNRYYVGKSITIEKARNVVAYLEEFERIMPCPSPTRNTSATRSKAKSCRKSPK